MIDPSNVIIHCPNGHQLQAARMDLDKPLACPICGVTFTPASAGPRGAVPGAAPLDLGYSGSPLSAPVEYPAYTNWMLALWAIAFCLTIGYGLFGAQYAAPPDPGQPLPPGAIGACALSCLLILAAPAAIVLQLMWIYRIHCDARRARGYDDVSPGLALGLSFIPLFNYPWTAWTMRKLAAFAATGTSDDRTRAEQALKASAVCMVVTVLFLALTCTNLSIGTYAGIRVAQELGATGSQVDSIELQRRVEAYLPSALQYAGTVLLVIGLVIYVWAVRKVETALYSFLGAIRR